MDESREYAEKIVDGLKAGISHFHAVQYMKDKLVAAGFIKIVESDKWNLEYGKSYYFTRNGTTLIAFTAGKAAEEVDLMKVIGCHTDSPCIKTAPITKVDNKLGYQQVNVQLYGGGIWRTWFDRDLGLAGKVVYKRDNEIKSALWDSKTAVMNVPNLCIHLDDGGNNKFEMNKETHLKPILASKIIDSLFEEGVQAFKGENAQEDVYNVSKKHFVTFLDRIAKDLGI